MIYLVIRSSLLAANFSSSNMTAHGFLRRLIFGITGSVSYLVSGLGIRRTGSSGRA